MTAHTPMQYIHDGRICIGFIYRRGVAGFEAFTADDRVSLGLFKTQREAADAISNAAEVAAIGDLLQSMVAVS